MSFAMCAIDIVVAAAAAVGCLVIDAGLGGPAPAVGTIVGTHAVAAPPLAVVAVGRGDQHGASGPTACPCDQGSEGDHPGIPTQFRLVADPPRTVVQQSLGTR